MAKIEEIRKNKLATVLESYANNVDEIRIVQAMKENKETTPKDYVLALADGLRFGNWPWIEPQLKKTLEYRQMSEGYTTRSLMNHPTPSQEEFIKKWTEDRHNTSCPAYAGNEFPCDCGMVK